MTSLKQALASQSISCSSSLWLLSFADSPDLFELVLRKFFLVLIEFSDCMCHIFPLFLRLKLLEGESSCHLRLIWDLSCSSLPSILFSRILTTWCWPFWWYRYASLEFCWYWAQAVWGDLHHSSFGELLFNAFKKLLKHISCSILSACL